MIKPLNNNVLVEVKLADTTKSGIIISTSEVQLDEAEVMAVASGVKGIEVGDIVFMKGYSAEEIEWGGRRLCFIKAENVLGKKT